MDKKPLQNKKVLVMGLGLHGGGIAVTKWLVKHRARVTVTDFKSKSLLAEALKKFSRNELRKIRWVLGQHRVADFKNSDLIVQNPAVPAESKFLKVARNCGIPIVNDAVLFFMFCPASIIGVTGTRGKSTTTTLIYELLKQGSTKVARKIWYAGLSQKPELEILDKIKATDLVILELSSWQLEGLSSHKLSPLVAVITNIYPDHLDRYSGMGAYVEAKSKIFQFQLPSDYAVLNFNDLQVKKFSGRVNSQRFWFSKKYFPEQNGCYVKGQAVFFRSNGRGRKLANLSDIKIAGTHNLENILAALTVAGIYRSNSLKIKKVLQTFKGLPGRIELVRRYEGVDYINDTTSTMPDATIAALKTLESKSKKIVLIAGGASKEIPDYKYKQLVSLINKYCKALILFSGQGSSSILSNLLPTYRGKLKVISNISSMSDAVGLANSLAAKGDAVLLSPACASFGLFANEFDRGNQFNRVVRGLK